MAASSRRAAAATAAPAQPPQQQPDPPADEPSAWDSRPLTYHLLIAGLPLTAVCAFLEVAFVATWFPIWIICRHLPLVIHRKLAWLPEAMPVLSGHALTVHACYRGLGPAFQTRAGALHLVSAVAMGLILGVGYKNLFAAVSWFSASSRLRGGLGSASGRESLVVSLLGEQGGAAPANPHGAREFGVKVTLTMQRGAKGAAEVHDQRRTFDAVLPQQADGMATLARLVALRGEGGGLHGFFSARREGSDLRIFVDRLQPPPAW